MDQLRGDMEPERHAHMAIGAAGLVAGYIAGACIVAGSLNEKDKRRVGEIVLTNFRQGVKIGKDNAARSIPKEGKQ